MKSIQDLSVVYRIIAFACIVIFGMACKKEEPETGSILLKSSFDITIFNGIALSSIEWGVYDPIIVLENSAHPNLALYKGYIIGDELEFKDLIPGNYIVAPVYSNEYKAAQVQAGEKFEIHLSEWE
jgi:hypothetical protein